MLYELVLNGNFVPACVFKPSWLYSDQICISSMSKVELRSTLIASWFHGLPVGLRRKSGFQMHLSCELGSLFISALFFHRSKKNLTLPDCFYYVDTKLDIRKFDENYINVEQDEIATARHHGLK